jgi:hypothetical protein
MNVMESDGKRCRTSQRVKDGWEVLIYTRCLIIGFSPRYFPKVPPKWLLQEETFFYCFQSFFYFLLDFFFFVFYGFIPCGPRHIAF